MDGKKFYEAFRNEFNPRNNKEVEAVYDKVQVSRMEWTNLVNKVLLEIMRKSKFDPSTHTKEEPLRRGKSRGLIDHKWQSEDKTIFLEHENDITNIDSEIKNLLNSDGDLRILITYCSDPIERKKLRENLHRKLKENKSSRKFEFLLILGKDYDMKSYDNWEAFRYLLTFEEIPA